MKRWIGVVVGLVAVVVGVVFWRLGGSGAKSSAPAVQANGVATAMGSAARRADPRMLQRGSIAGTVTDVAKRPIAGARVCADGSSDDAPPDVFEVPTCVDTDAKGGYRIEKLLAASYVVSANAKTYQPALFEATPYGFRLRAGEARGGVDIVLEAGGVELNGTVSDISGGPVAHARVRLSNGETMIGSPAETDQNGQFTLTSWPGGVSVTARADGYTEASGSGTAPGTIDVLLTPAASLSGTVVDAATGAPIEGARVSVEKTEGLTNHSAHSDADGKFRVQGLTPGRYVAEAISEHRYGRTAGSMLVGLGQDVEGAVVKVHPAQRVQGRVMIRGDKQSVCRDGYAHLQGAGTRRWVEGRTDPDGTITIDGVSPGRYSVSAGCGHDSTTNEIEVEDKDVLGLVWEVEVGATVRGRVLNRRGEPIAHVRVTGVRMPGDHRVEDDWVTTRSKSDGRYELAGLREGTYILDLETTKALAPRGGFTVEVARGVLASMDKVIEKDLVLEDGGQIDGLVVDEHGKPVRGVAVNARSVDSSWNRDGKSDGDGKFTLTAVHPGEYRVTAGSAFEQLLRRFGRIDGEQSAAEKTVVRAGETSKVRLVAKRQRGTIKGIVVDALGRPVPDAYVLVAAERDDTDATASITAMKFLDMFNDKPTLTNVDGTFVIGMLSPAKYTVRAQRKGGGEALVKHVAVGATTRLQIQQTGSIAGVAKLNACRTTDEITIGVLDPQTGIARNEAFYRTNGAFAIHDLPAGHFHVTASCNGGRKHIEVDLAAGENRTGVDLAFEALVTVTGRVVEYGTNKPVPGMKVHAQPASGSRTSSSSEPDTNITDDAGRFTLRDVPRGQIVVQGIASAWDGSDDRWVRVFKMVTGTSTTFDVGNIVVVERRVKQGDVAGVSGIVFKTQTPDTPPEHGRLEVSFIHPRGPAANSGIEVGDVVTSIDGLDVSGGNAAQAWMLMDAPPGTKLALGLSRGTTVTIVLASL